MAELLIYTSDDEIEVLKHYGRTPESVKIDVDIIRKWLNEQPHLPKDIFSDRRIKAFLMLNKMSIERTKSKLDMYCTLRKHIPEVYENTQPYQPHMKEFAKTLYYFALPRLTADRCRPILCALTDNSNFDNFDPFLFFAYTLNIGEIRIDNDMLISEIFIFDLKNVNVSLITKVTPTLIKRALTLLEKVYSIRLKGTHFINCPSFIDSFVTLVKSTMKAKLAERVHTHRTMDTLYEFVPKELLPKEYGGTEESVQVLKEKWDAALEQYTPWFEKLKSIEVDESLRPGKPIDDEYLGFHGNFRKLDVD